MVSPYSNRPPRSFWRSVVASVPKIPPGLYCKRFDITREDRIAAAGSCFAQHILASLVERQFNVIDVERAPTALSRVRARSFGYGIYSARYGNVYTARQMLQLAQEAFGVFEPGEIVWEKDGRFYDALRPSVEPQGLGSPEEVLAHRADHVRRVRQMFETASLFIFTLGLTEAWIHTPTGTVYPTAPETIAGDFDPALHSFKNFTFNEIVEDLTSLRELVRSHNSDIKFLLTVSPVPLVATASEAHVLVATTYSKSILRAAAGRMYELFEEVDYFPSYEMITSPFLHGQKYEADLRSVKPKAVAKVMATFFQAHRDTEIKKRRTKSDDEMGKRGRESELAKEERRIDEDVICDEKFLEAFGE